MPSAAEKKRWRVSDRLSSSRNTFGWRRDYSLFESWTQGAAGRKKRIEKQKTRDTELRWRWNFTTFETQLGFPGFIPLAFIWLRLRSIAGVFHRFYHLQHLATFLLHILLHCCYTGDICTARVTRVLLSVWRIPKSLNYMEASMWRLRRVVFFSYKHSCRQWRSERHKWVLSKII